MFISECSPGAFRSCSMTSPVHKRPLWRRSQAAGGPTGSPPLSYCTLCAECRTGGSVSGKKGDRWCQRYSVQWMFACCGKWAVRVQQAQESGLCSLAKHRNVNYRYGASRQTKIHHNLPWQRRCNLLAHSTRQWRCPMCSLCGSDLFQHNRIKAPMSCKHTTVQGKRTTVPLPKSFWHLSPNVFHHC